MYKLVAASIVTAITLSVAVPVVWADTALSGKEIKQLISGNTAVGERWKKRVGREYISKEVMFKTYFYVNGQLVEKGDAVVGGASASQIPAHGTWKVKKNKLCFTFSDSLRNKGKQMCRKVIQKDDGTYELTTGKGEVKRVWKEILPGNPHNLE